MDIQSIITRMEELAKGGFTEELSTELASLENEYAKALEAEEKVRLDEHIVAGGTAEDFKSTPFEYDSKYQELHAQLTSLAKAPIEEATNTKTEAEEKVIEPAATEVAEEVASEVEKKEEVSSEVVTEAEPETKKEIKDAVKPEESSEESKEIENKEEAAATKETKAEEPFAVPSSKKEIIDVFAGLLKQDDLGLVSEHIELLEEAYGKIAPAKETEKEVAKEEPDTTTEVAVKAENDEAAPTEEKAAVPAEEEPKQKEKPKTSDEDHRFRELINIYRDRKKSYEKEQTEREAANLEAKRKIVESLKALVTDEEKIAKAFHQFHELTHQWKEIGNVPAKEYKKLQNEYSHQIDVFFYTMDIYKALREQDLQKNLDDKNALVKRMHALLEEPSVKKMEMMVKALQNEWAETGPVPKDLWKDLRNNFWTATSDVYRKIQEHYDSVREVHQKNLEAKQALIQNVNEIVAKLPENHKGWQDQTKVVLDIQQQWRKIGIVPKRDNEKVWKEFRTVCDNFFNAKKAYYDSQKEVYEKHKIAKEKIIEKAEALKESTQWKQTTQALIALQEEWKKVGSAGQKNEQRLWKEFRATCDYFFNAKKVYFSTIDDRYATNLKQKKELIETIKEFKPGKNREDDIARLKGFSEAWRQVGHVSRKDVDKINDAYRKALDEQYDKLKISKGEKEVIRFKNKVEGLAAAENSEELIYRERRFLQDKVRNLESTIEQYENNLSFFGHSKGAEALKQDVLKKIEQSKAELETWRDKIKMLPKKQQHK